MIQFHRSFIIGAVVAVVVICSLVYIRNSPEFLAEEYLGIEDPAKLCKFIGSIKADHLIEHLMNESIKKRSLPHFRAVLDHGKLENIDLYMVLFQIDCSGVKTKTEFYRALACSKHVSYSDLVNGDLKTLSFCKWVNSPNSIPKYIKTCKYKRSAEDLETQTFEEEVLIDLKRMVNSFKISEKSEVFEKP